MRRIACPRRVGARVSMLALGWALACGAALGTAPQTAHAANRRCFGVDAASDSAKAPAGAKASSARRITLASRLSISAECEYGPAPEGPWVSGSKLAGVDDFASLLLRLLGQSGGDDATGTTQAPAGVFARRADAGPDAELESVFLAGECRYLLNAQHGLSLRVAQATQHPTFERLPSTEACGAAQLDFGFVELADSSSAAPAVVLRGPFGMLLAKGATRTALDPGSYAVYALRPGGVGYLIGELRSGSSLTPLRAALHEQINAAPAQRKPWLRASWARGDLRLLPDSAALRDSASWVELRGAAQSGALWFASYDASKRPAYSVLSKVLVDGQADALALPAAHVVARMRERYGSAGSHMVPTLGDWSAVTKGLSLCLQSHYEATPPSAASPVPHDALCATLSSLLAPVSAQSAGIAVPSGQVCVKHYAHELSVQGSTVAEPVSDTCITLPSAGAADALLLPAATGDTLLLGAATTQGLLVCTDNHCEPAPAAGTPLRLAKSGLVELRSGSDAEQARSAQGLTLLRLGVIDPARDWQPVGLYHAPGKPPDNRWSALDHDEPDVFSFVRGRDSLASALALSPALSAAWNAQAETAGLVVRQLPLVKPVVGTWASPKSAGMVLLATRQAQCSDKPAAALDGRDLVVPESLLVDEDFYVQLAVYEGEQLPYRCLARAHLRVAEHLSLRATSNLRAGLLGDTQALMFITNPPALGLAVPLVYARYRLVSGLGLDASGSLTVATALDHGALSRAGVGLSLAAYFGPERYAPRLLSLGVMLHAAGGSHPDKPLASVFLGLDVATLYDLVGGR